MPTIEDQPTRTFHTALGDRDTRDCPMGELAAGDRIVGPDSATVYEVLIVVVFG